MCLYPRFGLNPKYIANKKNGGVIPAVSDKRLLYVPFGCNKCIECMKRKGREWRVRMLEEVRTPMFGYTKRTKLPDIWPGIPNGKWELIDDGIKGYMVTFTLSNDSYAELMNEVKRDKWDGWKFGSCGILTGLYNHKQDWLEFKKHRRIIYKYQKRKCWPNAKGYDLDNAIITLAVRRFCERWRKKYHTSVKHWFISELGHNGTENIHLHGILWCNKTRAEVLDRWQYGFMFPRDDDEWKRNYVSEQTVNYCIKYFTKVDLDHKYYKPIILTSAGIGRDYVNRPDSRSNIYKDDGNTDTCYTTREGHKMAMPIYWRNKIYSEEEREKLWLELLDKNERYVLGTKARNWDEYNKLLEKAREKNNRLGYGDDKVDWNRLKYENEVREILQNRRINNNNKNEGN